MTLEVFCGGSYADLGTGVSIACHMFTLMAFSHILFGKVGSGIFARVHLWFVSYDLCEDIKVKVRFAD